LSVSGARAPDAGSHRAVAAQRPGAEGASRVATEAVAPATARRWWGWAAGERETPLAPALARLLDDALGLDGQERPAVALEQVALRAPTLNKRARTRLEAVVGAEWVRDDHATRVQHCGGRSYLDLVTLRAGRPRGAPDAVVYPDSHEAVLALLAICAAERVAVVPYGGGTSVTGGLAPTFGGQHAVVSLDLARLSGLLSVDQPSLTVTAAAGTRAPVLEAALAEQAMTLGHYPDSFELVSIGGCAATRSVGQAASGYGRIDQAIQGVRFATPAGELAPAALPASASGPALRELIVGSEGTLGVITGLLLRVRPRPAHQLYEGIAFESFESAAEALRVAVQDEATPDIVRLTDEIATSVALAAGEGGRRSSPLRGGSLRRRGQVLLIVGWEGQSDSLARRRLHAMTLLRRGGGVPIGQAAGRAWAASRFAGPHIRDELIARGVFVEQFETAAPWSRLSAVRAAVLNALFGSLGSIGTPPLLGCQLAHVYPTGASLTFTAWARAREGEEEEQWRIAKEAAGTAIVGAGATISHHHGVGRDHVAWAAAELGELGVATLRALKAQLDPAGVMNPGKLIAGG
jgi:alkyldihydroxyacetonephosphate synthase